MATYDLMGAKTRLRKLETQLQGIADKNDPTADDETRYSSLEVEADDLASEIRNETKRAELAELVKDPRNIEPVNGGVTGRRYGRDAHSGLPALDSPMRMSMSVSELRSRVSDGMEQSGIGDDRTKAAVVETVERFDTDGGEKARLALYTSRPAYVRAWSQLITQQHPLLTPEETQAVRDVQVLLRAMSVGTDTAGGFAVPAPIDPTWIITGAGTEDGILSVSRREAISNDTWTGISSAQITSSWDAEAAEVSDDSPVLAQPTVPVHKLSTFVPASLEVAQDIPALAAQLGAQFRDSQLNAINTALATGSGTGEPTGIVTALTGGAQEISSASTDAYAIADVYAVYDNQSPRYRDASTWAMNALVMTLTRQFGTADGHSFLAHLDASNRLNLLGGRVVFNSSMDGTVTALAENYLTVFGDFSNFVVAVRQPLVVEYIPHLFATGANRPSGQRGWYAWSRIGSDSVADGAFTMLNST